MPDEPKRISVCHVASGDLWAGAEAQVAALLRNLARIPNLRLWAVLLNEGRLADEIRQAGIETKVISESRKNVLAIFREARTFLEGKDIRVLHSHRYKENLLAAMLAWRCGIPYLVRTQHGLPEPVRGLKHYKDEFIQTLDRWAGRFATDRVISVSAELAGHLKRRLKPDQVIVIPNGLDFDRVHSRLSVAEAKKRLGLPDNCVAVGYAGRLEAIKRLDLFLAAAKRIVAQVPKARFLIVGEGSQSPRLRERARSDGLQDYVLFLGHRDDIYDVLRAFDIFLLCSDHEGLPMVLLEALSLGVPVVARRVGGVAEVIQDRITGLLLDSSDPSVLAEACLRLLSDDSERCRLAREGARQVVGRFAAERTAAQVAELYSSFSSTR